MRSNIQTQIITNISLWSRGQESDTTSQFSERAELKQFVYFASSVLKLTGRRRQAKSFANYGSATQNILYGSKATRAISSLDKIWIGSGRYRLATLDQANTFTDTLALPRRGLKLCCSRQRLHVLAKPNKTSGGATNQMFEELVPVLALQIACSADRVRGVKSGLATELVFHGQMQREASRTLAWRFAEGAVPCLTRLGRRGDQVSR